MYVGNSTIFKVDESNAGKFRDYEAFVVNELMQNFVNGTGAENYEFPKDGIISSKFKGSDIVNAALKIFEKEGELSNKQQIFSIPQLLNDLDRTGTYASISGFVGSGTITIIPKDKDIEVKIFNITSRSSGDYLKLPNNKNTWSRSYVRDPSQITPYGNISQTYSFTMPNPLKK